MTSEARRAAIVQAVLPVFARKGLDAATTRELAAAAEVSEALLFKHFITKEGLFAEVQALCCGGQDPDFDQLAALEPSTATLVRLIQYLVRSAALAAPHHDAQSAMRQRLFLGSCLADGNYGRAYMRERFGGCFQCVDACLSAAEKAGDLVESPVPRQNRVRFVHHLATMIAALHLPSRPAVDYGTSRQELVNNAVWFCLRGLGLTDAAIQRHFVAAAPEAALGAPERANSRGTGRGRSAASPPRRGGG